MERHYYTLKRRFGQNSSVHFQTLMMKKLRYKFYNEQITTCDNGNVQCHDQEESKLNSTIIKNSGTHAVTDDKIIKSPFKILKRFLLLRKVF